MRLRGKIVYKDKGLKAVFEAAKSFAHLRGRVGILGNAGNEISDAGIQKITIAEAAYINEFGAAAAGIPPRSFLRSVLNEEKSTIVQHLKNAVIKEVNKAANDQAVGSQTGSLLQVGTLVVEYIRHKIADGPPPPNAPKTIQEKGFDHPLIHNGQLYAAISRDVVSVEVAGTDAETDLSDAAFDAAAGAESFEP